MMETRKCLDIIAAASALMMFQGNFIPQFSSLIIGHFYFCNNHSLLQSRFKKSVTTLYIVGKSKELLKSFVMFCNCLVNSARATGNLEEY